MVGYGLYLDDDWAGVSEEAKSLIKQMLNINPRKRITAKQAYEHPWIQNNSRKQPLKRSIFKNLKTFKKHSKFKQAILTFFATRTLSSTDSAELMKAFQSLDTDGNGILSKEELILGYKTAHPDCGDLEIDHIISEILGQLDSSNKKGINFTQFVVATCNRKKILTSDQIKKVFQIFDEDGSGYIEWQELQHVMSTLQKKDEYYQKLLNEFDENGDGKVRKSFNS